MNHWFDGLAMLHRFSFADGQRLLREPLPREHAPTARREETGEIAYSEFATDPCRSLFQRVTAMFSPKLTDNANVNLDEARRALHRDDRDADPGRSSTPRRWPRPASPTTPPGQLTTAHPHMDRATKGMLNYAAKLGPRNELPLLPAAPRTASKPEVIATEAGVASPPTCTRSGSPSAGSCSPSSRYVVNPLRLAFSGRPYIENYRWKPELGTRFHLFDRDDGRERRPVRDRGALRLPPRQRLRGRRRRRGRHLHVRRRRDRRGPLPRAAARRASRSPSRTSSGSASRPGRARSRTSA